MSKVSLGADPEVFVRNKATGLLESAFGLIQGTKYNPLKVPNGAVQVDGMALEFNIDAAGSETEWIQNIDSVMSTLASMVPGHMIDAIPVADFGYEYIKAQPDEAKELGCDPDFDAWLVAQNPRPNGDNPFRTAAGHIHFGIIESNDAPVEDGEYIGWIAQKVRELDFHLGLPSLFYDADAKRRELYGKAGAFRPKSYGFEYRTLSNQWLGNESLKRWAYQASQAACEAAERGICLVDKYGDIQKIINSSDKAAAAKIIKAEGLILPAGIVI
ncbi:putative ligase [Erwinia phage Pecta]|nr:putative ligase [Erwinia phage Pecta]